MSLEEKKKKILLNIEKNYEKQILQAYKRAQNNIKLELIALEEKGLLNYTDMQNYNRLKSLQEKINLEINDLAKVTGKTLTEEQLALYKTARGTTFDILGNEIKAEISNNIVLLPKGAIKEAVKNPLDLVGCVQRNADNAANIVKKINQNILIGLVQGKSYAKIATGINKDIDVGYKNSLRIARTESHRVTEKATQDVYEYAQNELGLELQREWMSSTDDRTRDEHSEANGQVVGINEPFVVGGEQLMYPGDPAGSAWNTINCRCTTKTILKNFDKKQFDKKNK